MRVALTAVEKQQPGRLQAQVSQFAARCLMATLLPRDVIESGEMSLRIPDSGPVYYVVRSFHNLTSYRTLAADLLSSDLTWWWVSCREANDKSYDNPVLPDTRTATLLTQDTVDAFVADWEERNADGDGRDINLFGLDQEARDSSSDAQWLHKAVDAFEQGSPLRVIVMQEYDGRFQYIVTERHPPEVVRVLLANWGLHPGARVKVRRQKGELSAHTFVPRF
jgi:hypothetical protein